MPWTETSRAQYAQYAQYRRAGLRDTSDLTDGEWGVPSGLLPARSRLGRPRKVELRAVVDAILYILATGCQWRALPRELPPRSTVQSYSTAGATAPGTGSIAPWSAASAKLAAAGRSPSPASSPARV